MCPVRLERCGRTLCGSGVGGGGGAVEAGHMLTEREAALFVRGGVLDMCTMR